MTGNAAPPADLVAKYLTQLTARRVELTKFLAHCEEGKIAQEEREATRIHAHSLKGTGRTYGYPAITTAGQALEEAFDANADIPALTALTRGLIAACDSVLAASRDLPPEQENSVDITSVKAALQTSEGQKPTILVVDDDPAIRGMLQQMLCRDADILTAADSEEALAMMERSRPELVVLDDRLPGMGGIEMLEHLRAEGKPLPSQVIMLTANNRTRDIIAGMSAGAVDYITKPFEPDRLVNRIRNLLQRLRMTILIADDDAAIRGLLQHKFRMLGFRLIYAEDGNEALHLVRQERPHLAIIDRMMPGIDGLVVLQRIRDEAPLCRTPVILLTAKRQNKDVVQGFHHGATDYIVKPFMPEEVVSRAMRLLGLNGASRL